MKKFLRGYFGALLAFLLAFFAFSVSAASDTTDNNIDINATITIDCPESVTLNAITGTGRSTLDSNNEITCYIKTNDSAGYTLTFAPSTTDYLENANGDQIVAYTPTSAGTPEAWSVAASASEWGARLKSTSTTYDTKWGTAGTDTYAANWCNVTDNDSLEVVARSDETTATGDDETIQFGAEVGPSKWQPTGTYDANVVMTALSNGGGGGGGPTWYSITNDTYWSGAMGFWDTDHWISGGGWEVILIAQGWETGFQPTQARITFTGASPLTLTIRDITGGTTYFEDTSYESGDEVSFSTSGGDVGRVYMSGGSFDVYNIEWDTPVP